MVWVRLDDGFSEHPKVVAAGPIAAHLFVSALCYCNRNLTDGFIPEDQAMRLVRDDGVTALLDRLVSVGLFERDAAGYRIHDFLDFNPPRKKVMKSRKANKERQRKWKAKREKLRSQQALRAKSGNGVNNAPVTPAPYPPPPPTPLGVRGKGEGAGARALKERGAAPGKERISKAISDACRVGVHEERARNMIDAHGIDAVEKANGIGLARAVRQDGVEAWFDAVKGAE